ncbi:putative galactose-specific lectin nattectin-like [Scophthalmus maximus]|uniref:Putative galactose-specific lectin nattectin-like n=1 Tax=Scophthalmus maximus TaxID=52904 RepID=A0A2U9B030_SCOMX|nr:putative galactose-specific lectin nattectin-like [Scophthalmus maximus]KAF0028940.1 hypothetical protein F2P81_018045 [Scophthalmus maximus]
MKVLGVCLTVVGILLTLSQAFPLNSTGSIAKQSGLCEFDKQQCSNAIGSFCPQCDANGNFLPRQCWPSTGSCWCVDVNSGIEIANTLTPPGVVPVKCGRGNSCPYGWTSYAKRCFIFIDTPKTWTEAEIYCQFDGANLASIQSYEENHFLMSLTRGDTHNFPQTWIGGFDAIEPGYWMWSDGSKFYYENWYNTDKMYNRNETCLRMNYGCNKLHTQTANYNLPCVVIVEENTTL